MNELKILGIYVRDRIKEANRTQKLLSEYSSVIRTRLGFHEVSESKCSRNAMIIIEMKDNGKQSKEFIEKLQAIGGIEVKEMNFDLS
jgi:hypothetical protein